jgi:hypothetical protein
LVPAGWAVQVVETEVAAESAQAVEIEVEAESVPAVDALDGSVHEHITIRTTCDAQPR